MPDQKPIRAMAGTMMAVMFLFGIAVGYIVRDVRADEQIRQAAINAQEDVRQTALAALDRARDAGATVVHGAQAAAESTKTAAKELTGTDGSPPR